MTKRKWLRLWILLSGILFAGTTVAYSYYVWGQDACYRITTISISESATTPDYALAKQLQGEHSIFCGKQVNPTIANLESLAERGAVTQISFEWLEPQGWSMGTRDTLDIQGGKNIRAQSIIADTQSYVHKARLEYALWWPILSVALSFSAFTIGWGIAWVRRG